MAEMNQRVGGPYGDIVIVNTPQLDKMGQQFYKEDLMRQRQQEAAAKAAEKDLKNDLTKIRSADIPDNIKLYNDWKQSKINLLKKGDKATPLDHQEVLQKQAAYFQHTNDSIAEKEQDKQAVGRVNLKPIDYLDNAHQVLSERRKKPVSELYKPVEIKGVMGHLTPGLTVDQRDIYGLIKNPADNNDYLKETKQAAGTPVLRGNTVTQPSKGGLTNTIIQYKAPNSATEYITTLTGMGDDKLNKISRKFNYSDDEAANIKQQYEAFMQTPAAKAAYPNEPAKLPDSLFATPKGRALATMAMEHVLMNPPVEVRKTEKNEKALLDYKNAQQRNLAIFRAALKGTGKSGSDVEVNDLYQKIYDNDKTDYITIRSINGKPLDTPIKAGLFNNLPQDAQAVVAKYIKDAGYEDISAEQIFTVKQPDGRIQVYKTKEVNGENLPQPDDKTLLATIPRVGTNIKVQANTKGKQAVISQGEPEKKIKTFSIVNPKTGQVVMEGVSEEQANKAKAKGYNIQ